eukprot:6062598-Pyramimonas_sp.AAC.1
MAASALAVRAACPVVACPRAWPPRSATGGGCRTFVCKQCCAFRSVLAQVGAWQCVSATAALPRRASRAPWRQGPPGGRARACAP